MSAIPTATAAITMFTEDLVAAKSFYQKVFAAPVLFEDEHSVAFRFDHLVVNLLAPSAAEALIAPARVGGADAATRFQLTVEVDDVDAACAVLADRGVELLNGPMDRPWGLRTASFKDPSGHVWELAADLA